MSSRPAVLTNAATPPQRREGPLWGWVMSLRVIAAAVAALCLAGNALAQSPARPGPAVHNKSSLPAPSAPRQQSYFEQEALAYASTVESVSPDVRGSAVWPVIERYWQRRLDLADRVDRGQVSPEAASKLWQSYRVQAADELKAQQDQLQRQLQQQQAQAQQAQAQAQAQQAAQEQAAAEARREQQNRALIEMGMRLMNSPRPPPPVFRPPVICTTRGNTTICN
jgi:hypothetical protein